MQVASGIRKALHEHGVHSSTIQPEFGEHADDDVVSGLRRDVFPFLLTQVCQGAACLIRCPPDCEPEACCPPVGDLVDVDGNPSDGADAPSTAEPNYSSETAV